MGNCKNCYFRCGCERSGACEHYYDYLGVNEDEELYEIVENGREAYYDEYAAYLREWND